MKFVRRHFRGSERIYAYFNTGQKRDGKVIYARLPDLSAPEFFSSYAAYKAGRTKRATKHYALPDMADDFLARSDLALKAESTREIYRIQLAKAARIFHSTPVNELASSDIVTVLDGEEWGAATQNSFVAVIGALYHWGRKRGKTSAKPTEGVEKRKTGQHEPWPEDILEAALGAEDSRIRLAVHLLYFTGQRIGDICKMRWGQVRDGYVSLTQQKTSKVLSFPIHSALAAELDRTPKVGLFILCTKRGGQISAYTISAELRGFTEAQGMRRVAHGLRKNAVNSLLEAGCSPHEVSAITGQSIAMVEHYAARVDKRKLGTAAMLKFEKARA